MNAYKPESTMPHHIIIENRKNISISGVIDIEIFEETHSMMITSMGTLELLGESFRLLKSNTDTGELLMEGNIFQLYYTDSSLLVGKKKKFRFLK